jgi:hypothetical protein
MAKYSKENKRVCATIFLNHLIDMGVVTLDGHRGENFNTYVVSLNAESWGNFTVHNARTKVEHALGVGNFFKSDTGEPGCYKYYLRYAPHGQTIAFGFHMATTKREARNIAYFEFAKELFAAKVIPAARS